MAGLAVLALGLEVERVELVAAIDRPTVSPSAADDRLLAFQRLAVPGLDAHVDLAGDEVGAARQPVGAVPRRGPTRTRRRRRRPPP